MADFMRSFRPDAPSAAPDFMRSFRPDAPDPSVVAHSAADSSPQDSAKALEVARESGLDPAYVADNLPDAIRLREKARLAVQLTGRPVLSAWAAQSPQHAAALMGKQDASVLGKLEGWFSDMGEGLVTGGADIVHAEAMREYMGSGGPWAKYALDAEDYVRNYDSQEHGYGEQVMRAVPQMLLYGLATRFTGSLGVAALIYSQNKGVLARQIQLAQPPPLEDGTPSPDALTADEVDKYATIGSAVGAVTTAGLMSVLARSLPGVRQGVQRVGAGILARGAATTVGRAALRTLLGYGAHTASGALGMALQATVNNATVQAASRPDVDYGQLAREGTDTFLKVLPVMATFAAYEPARYFMEERARLNLAPVERAKVDAMIALARKSQLTNHSQQLASDLFGAMGRKATAYIDYRAAQKMTDLPPDAVAAAEVAQGDVAVPLSDYVAGFADQHDAVRDDVKLSATGMNMNEARARAKELREVLTPEDASALYGKLPPDELGQWDMPPETTSEIPPDKTGKFAVPGENKSSWADHLVAQYGGKAEEWKAKLTPELMAALKEEGSKGAVAPEEHAARFINALPVDSIDPAPFRRQEQKAVKYIQEAAEKARSGSVAGAKASSPADVAVLSTYELARDVNRAKAERAQEVQAEMAKSLATITKASGDNKLRALLGRAGTPLLHLFDVLTEGTDAASGKNILNVNRRGWMAAHQEAVDAGAAPFSPDAAEYANARMSGALEEAKAWFRDTARPIQFDERALQKFLDKPKPWGELTPPEARNVADVVKQVVMAAREEAIIRHKDAEASVAEVASEISGELRQNPSKGLPLASGVPSGFWRNRALDANAANAVQLRAKNNLRQKSEAAAKWIFDRINQAVYARDGYFRDVGGQWDAAYKSMPADVAARRYETYDLSDKLPVKGQEPMTAVPRQWIWKLARHRMSAGNMDVVTSTSGWDRTALDGILFDDAKTKLTVPEWDFLQGLADVNEKYVWPKMKDHFEKFYGVGQPKTGAVPFRVQLEDGTWKDYAGGYEPLKRDSRPGVAPQPEPTKGVAQYWGRDFQVPSTPSSAKARVDNAHYLVNMDWDTSRASMASTLHWLAFDQPVRDVAKLLNDPGLAADMNEYMGQGRADMTRSWLKSSATQQAQSIPEGMEIVAKTFGWQRRLELMRIVGGSARLAVAQLSHPFGLMLGGEVNPRHGLPALISTFKPLTMENGEVRLFPNWNDAINYGQEVQHRADRAYQTLRRTWDNAGPIRPGPLGALQDLAKRTAGVYLHAVDRLTTSWAWTAFHNEAVAKFDMEPFSKEAIDYADGKTQDVMPVHDIETAAPILTNQQVGGFLIMHGFKNTLYQFRQDALAKSSREFHLAGTPAQYGSAAARTAGRIGLQLAMFGGFSIMGKFALGYGQQEDESKGQYLARDFLAGQSVDLPIIGGLGEPFAKLATGQRVNRRDFTLYGNPGLAAANKAYDLLGNLTSEKREDSKKVFDAVEAALFFGGLPSRAPRVGAEHLYETLVGEKYDDASDGPGRYFYTDKQWESIRRSLTPDED